MANRDNFWTRFMDRHAPSREEVLESRWLRPFGERIKQSDLWRFTRRSVPRGVFAGLFIGIFLLIPGLQIVGAALMSVPIRGNIPIAAAMTFLTNPLTTPFLMIGAIEVGNDLGFHADLAAYNRLTEMHAGIGSWLAWLLSDAAPALVTGLFLIGLVLAFIGYFVSVIGWRWWVGRKWRQRYPRLD